MNRKEHDTRRQILTKLEKRMADSADRLTRWAEDETARAQGECLLKPVRVKRLEESRRILVKAHRATVALLRLLKR